MTDTDKKTRRFMSKREMILSPLVEGMLLLLAAGLVRVVCLKFDLSFFMMVVTFYAALVVLTLLSLKIIRNIWPLRPGVYLFSDESNTLYSYSLQGFLVLMNMTPLLFTNVVPAIFKKYFYMLMGAKMGGGVITIAGRIMDPSLVDIEESVMIGDDCLLLSHAITTQPFHALVLGRIKIHQGAIIGARSILMPGVVVGENATIAAGSLVSMNTIIPANEMWGGIPAKPLSGQAVEPPSSKPKSPVSPRSHQMLSVAN